MAMAIFSLGSSTFTGWKRRVRAASFSKYFLYSAHVVAAIVRSSPRASAGFSRLAASFWPACAAGADQRMRFVDEENDRLGAGLGLLDHRFQPVLEFALHARAGLQQAEIESAQGDVAQCRRHVAGRDAQREALDDRGLADARFAGEDRIVLPTARQDVDHLTDFEVAPEDRIDLAGLGLRREVDRELVERRRSRPAGFRPNRCPPLRSRPPASSPALSLRYWRRS